MDAAGHAARIARATSAARQGLRTMCSPAGLHGTARELAWIAAHLVSYPFGVADEPTCSAVERHNLDGLHPVQRALVIGDVEAAGTPILLVHGFIDNRSIFTLLRRALRRRGFGRIATLNYSVFTGDVRQAARLLERAVERMVEETGFERIHVVGHSLGGLIARYYVQRMGGDARVHTLVTLGTPHTGTRAAHLLPHQVCRQLRPGSELLRELAEVAPGCRTRFVAFWSDLDQLISPKRAARLDHPDLRATNVLVRGVGHMSLPIHRRIVHDICMALAHLDVDGSTLTAGVTAIGAGARRSPAADRPGPAGVRRERSRSGS